MAASPRCSPMARVGRLGFAVVVLTILVSALWTIRSHPVRHHIGLPPAYAIGPGIGIDVTYADGSGDISCTAGFLVRTLDGRPALLSAGHCNKPGGPATVSIHHDGSYVSVGTFTDVIYDSNDWNTYDIGLITLDDTGSIPLTPDVDGHPMRGLADHVEIGEVLCHFGIRSGRPICGPVVVSEPNNARFTAAGTCGDSGGPVYRVRPDNTVEAVGIYVAVTDGDYSDPKCDEPHEFSIVQLIKPWLRSWELTLITTPA